MTNPQEHVNSRQVNPVSGPALSIKQGRTEFPLRPITKQRFLIGAGNICDLQLGDAEIPLLHTIMLFDQGSLYCESVVSSPELKLNGKMIRQATLINGDQLEIGKYAFQVHLHSKAECQKITSKFAESLESIPGPHELEDNEVDLWNLPAEERQDQISEMSALELVDRLEEELEQLEEMEEIKLAGLDAMITEALEIHARDARIPMDAHQEKLKITPKEDKVKEAQLDELQSLIKLITEISNKYVNQEHLIPADVREELVEAQEQLQLLVYMMDLQKRSA